LDEDIMVQKWKIVFVESLVFLVLSSFHNYKFLDDWTKIQWFINNTNSTIAGRHPYDWCGKKCAQNGIDMREKWMVILAIIQCNSTQNHKLLFFKDSTEKIQNFLGLLPDPLAFWAPCTSSPLSYVPIFCSMGK